MSGKEGKVIVALNTDEFIQRYKGTSPIMSYKERKECLLSCKYVDGVVPNIGEEDSKKTIMELREKVNLVVIGSDWHEKDYLQQMHFTWDWLRKNEIGICYVPYTENISTTKIKERMYYENPS